MVQDDYYFQLPTPCVPVVGMGVSTPGLEPLIYIIANLELNVTVLPYLLFKLNYIGKNKDFLQSF